MFLRPNPRPTRAQVARLALDQLLAALGALGAALLPASARTRIVRG
jgi:hypothetical protein